MAVNFVYQYPSDNKAPSGTPTVTAGTASTDYPIAYLTDLNPAKPFKFTTTSGTIRWDYGAAQRIDLVAIIHHNLDAGLSVRIQGNATDSWGSPTFDQAITISGPTEDLYPVNAGLDLTTLSGYSASGFRYWRLVLGGTNSVAISIGEVWLGGLKRSLSPNIDWGIVEDLERKVVEHMTDFAVISTYDLGVTVRRLKGTLDTTDAGRAAFTSWVRATKGKTSPMVCFPFGDGTEPWMAKIASPARTATYNLIDRNGIPVEVVEMGRGLRP